MLVEDRIQYLAADNAAVADCARGNLGVPILACPGWTMVDLVKHVSRGQSWFLTALTTGATETADVVCEPSPDDEELLVDWYLDIGARLETAIRSVDQEAGMRLLWNDDGVSGGPEFLRRRIGNEVVVHRWEAQEAVGQAGSEIPDDLAVDILDELLAAWLPWAASAGRQAQGEWSGQTVQLRTGDHAWRVEFVEPGDVRVQTGIPDGGLQPVTTSISGPASSLVLFSMNRLTSEEGGLEVQGDRRVLDRWRTEVRFGARTPAAASAE